QRLESRLSIHGESGLTESHICQDLPAHQLEVVCEIAQVSPEKQPRQQVKATIRHDLEEGVIEQHAVTRKPAAHNDVIAIDGAVEEVTKFWQEMLKVAIH